MNTQLNYNYYIIQIRNQANNQIQRYQVYINIQVLAKSYDCYTKILQDQIYNKQIMISGKNIKNQEYFGYNSRISQSGKRVRCLKRTQYSRQKQLNIISRKNSQQKQFNLSFLKKKQLNKNHISSYNTNNTLQTKKQNIVQILDSSNQIKSMHFLDKFNPNSKISNGGQSQIKKSFIPKQNVNSLQQNIQKPLNTFVYVKYNSFMTDQKNVQISRKNSEKCLYTNNGIHHQSYVQIKKLNKKYNAQAANQYFNYNKSDSKMVKPYNLMDNNNQLQNATNSKKPIQKTPLTNEKSFIQSVVSQSPFSSKLNQPINNNNQQAKFLNNSSNISINSSISNSKIKLTSSVKEPLTAKQQISIRNKSKINTITNHNQELLSQPRLLSKSKIINQQVNEYNPNYNYKKTSYISSKQSLIKEILVPQNDTLSDKKFDPIVSNKSISQNQGSIVLPYKNLINVQGSFVLPYTNQNTITVNKDNSIIVNKSNNIVVNKSNSKLNKDSTIVNKDKIIQSGKQNIRGQVINTFKKHLQKSNPHSQVQIKPSQLINSQRNLKPLMVSSATIDDFLAYIQEYELSIGFIYLYVENSKQFYIESSNQRKSSKDPSVKAFQIKQKQNKHNQYQDKYQRLSFLMMRKFMYEKNRIIKCLRGLQPNIFKLTGIQIPDDVFNKFVSHAQVKQKCELFQKQVKSLFKELEQFYNLIKMKGTNKKDKLIRIQTPVDNFSSQIINLLISQLNDKTQQIQHLQQNPTSMTSSINNLPQNSKRSSQMYSPKLQSLIQHQIQINQQRCIEIMEMVFLIGELCGWKGKRVQLFADVQFANYYQTNADRVINVMQFFQRNK